MRGKIPDCLPGCIHCHGLQYRTRTALYAVRDKEGGVQGVGGQAGERLSRVFCWATFGNTSVLLYRGRAGVVRVYTSTPMREREGVVVYTSYYNKSVEAFLMPRWVGREEKCEICIHL